MAQQHPTAVPDGLALEREPQPGTGVAGENGAAAGAVTRPYDTGPPPEPRDITPLPLTELPAAVPSRIIDYAPRFASAPYQLKFLTLPSGEQAAVITGGIILTVRFPGGEVIDMEADRVVEQGRLHRHGVEAQVGHDRRHPEGMGQVGDAGGPAAPGVALAGQLEGAAHGGGVGPGVALADPLEQRLDVRLRRQPGVIGPGDGPGGRAVLAGHGGAGLGLAVERQPVGDRRRMLLRHRAWPHPGWSSVAARRRGRPAGD